MRAQQLGDRIGDIKAASNFQHKLIDSIYVIMLAKRKSQDDYRISLEGINRQLERYIVAENGFLTEIVKSFQSYVVVMHQNQKALIQGYDQQILHFLKTAKQSKFEETIAQKVRFVDNKVIACREKISTIQKAYLEQAKKLVRDNDQELQLLNSEIKLRGRMNELSEPDKKSYAEKFADITKLKQGNEENLEQHVDSMMDLTMLHNQTLEQLTNYETVHLEEKANEVFDNFMRAFVLEVSFIRNLQFDVTSILQKVKEKQEEHRKIALDALRNRMKKDDSKIKRFFWDTYKTWTNNPFEINEHYINPRIRAKWQRVCDYYNKAM